MREGFKTVFYLRFEFDALKQQLTFKEVAFKVLDFSSFV